MALKHRWSTLPQVAMALKNGWSPYPRWPWHLSKDELPYPRWPRHLSRWSKYSRKWDLAAKKKTSYKIMVVKYEKHVSSYRQVSWTATILTCSDLIYKAIRSCVSLDIISRNLQQWLTTSIYYRQPLSTCPSVTKIWRRKIDPASMHPTERHSVVSRMLFVVHVTKIWCTNVHGWPTLPQVALARKHEWTTLPQVAMALKPDGPSILQKRDLAIKKQSYKIKVVKYAGTCVTTYSSNFVHSNYFNMQRFD